MKISIPWPLITIPKYRIIIDARETFVAQRRNSLFSKWETICSGDHTQLTTKDHWTGRHTNIDAARQTLRARKLYDELQIVKCIRRNYKEYL